MYETMAILQTMDNLYYEAQRQGRISFYVTSIGEEAINVASAAALSSDDLIFPQYREQGVLLWRGFTLKDFASQCFANDEDSGKGRQMPVHYGSKKLNYITVSSTVGTQLPHAVGAAYSLKMAKEEACTVAYFGDGGTSEGDFHAAMNFASVLEVPVLFICRNNGWAISTPASDQYRSDGVVVKGQAYGIRSFRVDGNDTLAMYSCVQAARKMAIEESRPILIEALTYRIGHHTTSDDSSKYRSITEMERWKSLRDPVIRFRKWLEGNAWWDEVAERRLRATARNEVITTMVRAEILKKPPLSDLFKDVYDSVPVHLQEQEAYVRSTVTRHPKDHPSDVPL
ncbi:hypothetical protein O6H91_06G022400 [Diphasiastrum complanatum]|nr:hypothetical protein O6H91_06G022400 [Diphasiastrum complanatum]